ncbi:MAG: mannose-6-phosphate isomerase, class I [Treponema sp.]|jgi:mannose-6-phosphate isomerase|nr:mannose-6-phosphate isomerase, class I [Treponema sp.]
MTVFKLKNQIKHYEWGSTEWIPSVLGIENPDSLPFAELWMGVHPAGPSVIADADERLDTFIARNSWSDLPFLFKALAADKPLSIQAHPSKAQAIVGFERENRAEIPIDASERNYKDTNHKPEIICALTPFKAMAGFREIAEIRFLLDAFGLNDDRFISLKAALDNGLRTFLQALFGLSVEAKKRISDHILENCQTLCTRSPNLTEIWETAASFATLYNGDPAVLSPLYLNLIDLEPGEAMFLPSGVLHAYIHGFGIELMANSDNVLRGGLTPKHIDVEELLNILKFSPFKPDVLHPSPVKYPTQIEEFSLSVLKNAENLSGNGSAIVFVTEGSLIVSENEDKIVLKRGESAFFAPLCGKRTCLRGDYTAYAAACGDLSFT